MGCWSKALLNGILAVSVEPHGAHFTVPSRYVRSELIKQKYECRRKNNTGSGRWQWYESTNKNGMDERRINVQTQAHARTHARTCT